MLAARSARLINLGMSATVVRNGEEPTNQALDQSRDLVLENGGVDSSRLGQRGRSVASLLIPSLEDDECQCVSDSRFWYHSSAHSSQQPNPIHGSLCSMEKRLKVGHRKMDSLVLIREMDASMRAPFEEEAAFRIYAQLVSSAISSWNWR
jgi:hypothetical protein